jgi:hypothetical protein
VALALDGAHAVDQAHDHDGRSIAGDYNFLYVDRVSDNLRVGSEGIGERTKIGGSIIAMAVVGGSKALRCMRLPFQRRPESANKQYDCAMLSLVMKS